MRPWIFVALQARRLSAAFAVFLIYPSARVSFLTPLCPLHLSTFNFMLVFPGGAQTSLMHPFSIGSV